MRKMAVISVSLNERNLEVLDNLEKELGLAGRSEAIRACLRSAEAELKERATLKGEVEGVLVTVHRKRDDQSFDDPAHHHMDIITTQLHSHLKNDKCLNVIVIKGQAERVKRLMDDIHKGKDLEYLKFIPS
jgi:CopG family nickel-responsive transcriptional regulator